MVGPDMQILRQVIRSLILENFENDEDVDVELPYEDTLMPDETGKGIVGGPDLSDQPRRNDFLEKKAEKRERSEVERLQSGEVDEEDSADEHAVVGAMGPAWGSVDEYDEYDE